jgi:hypothetical protein
MRNKRTKITFLLLACAVIISLLNGNKVSADSKIDNGFEYTVEDNKITITNYIGSETNLVIPSHINNLPVACIGEEAFAYNNGLTSVDIPNTVTIVENYAFLQCSSLETITIPKSVTSIGLLAFLGKSIKAIRVDIGNMHYKSMDGVLYSKDSSVLIKYPSAKTDLSYTVPDTVVTISASAFYQSNNLISIVIGSNVKEIQDAAFSECQNLSSLYLPRSVTTIGKEILLHCNSLKSVDVEPSNTSYSSIDGVLYGREETILIQYPIGKTNKNFIALNSVRTIGSSAFAFCESLESVKLPAGIVMIEDYAFMKCTNLNKINFPSELISIGVGAFIETNLTEVVLPRTIESIGTRIFYRCLDLKSVEILGSIKTIPEEAFLNCFNLTTVKLPTSITRIEKGAFYICQNLQSVGVLNRVTTIGKDAFKECNNIRLTCYKGSLAYDYAIKNRIPVDAITPTAIPNTSSILLDGKSVKLECYTIDEFNYFKLRDIAMILQDTSNKFDVKWDQKTKAIQLLEGVGYTVTGGELTFSNISGKINASVATSNIYIGDQEADLSAFVINEYNYFKLRDIGEALHLGVGYDATNNTIMIGTGWRPTPDSTYKTYLYGESEISVEIRYADGMPISGNLYVSIDGGEWHQIGNEDYLYGYTGTIDDMNQSLGSDRYIDFKDGWIYVQAINYKDGGVNAIHKVNIETGETIKVE